MLLGATGCGPAGFEVQASGSAPRALNEPLRVASRGGHFAPWSVTSRSVQVLDPAGRSLEHEALVVAGLLEIRLRVDAEMLAAAPPEVVVHLAGGLDVHGVRSREGRRLAGPVALRFPVRRRLVGRGAAPALVGVQGGAPGDRRVDLSDGRLRLVFDGALDPDSLGPGCCPVGRWSGSTALSPIDPALSWSLVGQRTTLDLDVSAEGGADHRLRLRDWSIRGLDGRAPEPLVTIDLGP